MIRDFAWNKREDIITGTHVISCHYFTTIDIISQQEIFDSPVSSQPRPGRQSGDPI